MFPLATLVQRASRAPFCQPSTLKISTTRPVRYPAFFSTFSHSFQAHKSTKDLHFPQQVAHKKTAQEWRTVLSPAQFKVLREKYTERAYSGEYDKHYPAGDKEGGIYECAGCQTPLYKASTKFDSGCGWPAFYDAIEGAVGRLPDEDGHRVEIVCNACGGHLGHIFEGEGFKTPTDERHCVNSISLRFKD